MSVAALGTLPLALVLAKPPWLIKCVACVTPSDLSLVEGWILGHETGAGGDGFGILGGILSLLSVASPRNKQGVLTRYIRALGASTERA